MKKKKLHLPIKIFGEDIIIDYVSKDVIFPNRPEESEQLRFKRIAAISNYLKEEGFLDFLPDEEIISDVKFSPRGKE